MMLRLNAVLAALLLTMGCSPEVTPITEQQYTERYLQLNSIELQSEVLPYSESYLAKRHQLNQAFYETQPKQGEVWYFASAQLTLERYPGRFLPLNPRVIAHVLQANEAHPALLGAYFEQLQRQLQLGEASKIWHWQTTVDKVLALVTEAKYQSIPELRLFTAYLTDYKQSAAEHFALKQYPNGEEWYRALLIRYAGAAQAQSDVTTLWAIVNQFSFSAEQHSASGAAFCLPEQCPVAESILPTAEALQRSVHQFGKLPADAVHARLLLDIALHYKGWQIRQAEQWLQQRGWQDRLQNAQLIDDIAHQPGLSLLYWLAWRTQ